jgi:hypothetical protein
MPTGGEADGGAHRVPGGEVERLASEIQRLDEESEFVQKLLTERAQEQGATLPRGDEHA